jgi:choline dehydrogenase-like flavoprotein
MSEIDYNIYSKPGVSYLQASTLNGWRHTAFRAFITEVLHRPNLHIMLGTHVTKILIDPRTKTAHGVEFIRRGKRYTIKARKEVVLSSGVFNSPQLLMLSGIGPKSDLNELGIPVIHDLPVGRVMRDHYIYFGLSFVMNTTGNSVTLRKALSPASIARFAEGQGDISLPGGGEALSFIQTKFASRGFDVPDVEFFELSGGLHTDHGVLVDNYNIRSEIYDTVYRPLIATRLDTMTPTVITFHPKSTGYIKLRNKNPFSHPLIHANILDHPDDVETILEAVKFGISLLKTNALKNFGARVHSIPLPPCAHLHFGSDDYWRCSIRNLVSTVHHQTSTCKMGNSTLDKYAVVNSELRVYGINRLRVVDTSIIPEPTSGHTNAVSYMIGEKAADMIKESWRN